MCPLNLGAAGLTEERDRSDGWLDRSMDDEVSKNIVLFNDSVVNIICLSVRSSSVLHFQSFSREPN